MNINTNYAQFIHSYEAIRVPANSVPEDQKSNIIRKNADDTVLLLTEEAQKQMEEDRANYSNFIMTQLEVEQAQKSADSEKEAIEDLTKIMSVFRSMCQGNNVPLTDERKLMEYDDKLYNVAKQAQIKAQLEKNKTKEEESLWKDEDKKTDESNDTNLTQIGQVLKTFKETQNQAVVETAYSSETNVSQANFDMSI